MTVTPKSRERLLAAATELFAEHGFEKATVAAVARRAHTSQSQLLKHFGDKNGLLAAVLRGGWQQLNFAIRLAIARIPSAADQLSLILDMLLSYLEANKAFSQVLLRDGDRLIELDGGLREFTEILDGVFEWMLATSESPSRVSPHALRVGLTGALRAMLRERALLRQGASAFSENEIRLVFSNFVSSCVRILQQPLTRVPEALVEQKDQAWVNHYLELADVAFPRHMKRGLA